MGNIRETIRKIGSNLEPAVTTRRAFLIPEPLQGLLQFAPAFSEIRLQCEALPQARYSLRALHGQFLFYGSIPVALIARVMLEEEDLVTGQQEPE